MRVRSLPERVGPAAASERFASVRRVGAAPLREHRTVRAPLPDGGEPNHPGADLSGALEWPAAFFGLWPLRCAARRTVRVVAIASVRAADRGALTLRARSLRQQRPAPGALERGRGLAQNRCGPAVRLDRVQ